MSNITAASSGTVVPRRRSRLAGFVLRLVREKRLGTVGAVIVLLLLLVGIFSPLLAPHDVNKIHLRDRFASPSSDYLLGADSFGRDTFSRLIVGARISVIVGLSATSICIVVAVIIGVLSGFFGGRFDLILQRFVDAWYSFPSLLVLLTVMSMVGKGLPQIIVVLGVLLGIHTSRVVRSAVIGIKENDYFLAAQAIGSPTSRTLRRHVMPNIMAPIIVIFSISVGDIILSEASLSFLGYGVPPDVPSWGNMLSLEGRQFMEQSPMLAIYPGLCLTLVVYGINVLGDALRDLLDPRLRGGV